MAYAAAVSVSNLGNVYVVTIAETECAATSEATISLGFPLGRVLKQACSKASGTAATVNPLLGTTANPANNSIVIENTTAAQPVANVVSGGGMPFVSNGTLYHRSKPNAGTDNTIETVYIILSGLV